jgi:hypothetical protein
VAEAKSSSLFLDGYIDARRGIRHCNCLCRGFAVFAPGFQRVRARRNILDRERAVAVGQREVWCRNNYNVTNHVDVKIAEELCRTNVVELE